MTATNNIKRNPASRLREILIAAKASTQKTAREAWCEVFGISEPNSEGALFEVQSRLLSLRKLFSDTESALRQIPDINEDLFVSHIERLASVVNIISLHADWIHFKNRITDNDMFALQYSEDLLRQNLDTQENEIPSDEIKTILAELGILYEAIFASSLPSDLKNALLDLIQEMQRGVHEYRVRGAVALKDSLTKSLGILAANKQAIEENSDSPEIQSLGKTLVRIDSVYSFAMRMRPLLQAAAHIIPMLVDHIK